MYHMCRCFKKDSTYTLRLRVQLKVSTLHRKTKMGKELIRVFVIMITR